MVYQIAAKLFETSYQEERGRERESSKLVKRDFLIYLSPFHLHLLEQSGLDYFLRCSVHHKNVQYLFFQVVHHFSLFFMQ